MPKNNDYVHVVGAGLAGAEAAWQAARAGRRVVLSEMKPREYTPAHHSPLFAELVCSNSLRAAALTNTVGLLKEEMRQLDSLIMRAADACAVPAGGALAVDRESYAAFVTEAIRSEPLIEVREETITSIPTDAVTIIATGPLTDGELAADIARFTGESYFHFFDAAAPIVFADSLDMTKIYRASRYGKGEAAYLNCPLNKEEYLRFRKELGAAETAGKKEFEKGEIFEGCMPIEVLSARGEDTMRFGPLKPVGLPDPRTGEEPYAVIQLRQDNAAGTLYNLVGFQTHLKWGEQERIFRLIPGLERAEFARFGVMHRNSYINSPKVLYATLQSRTRNDLFFAGQLTGVEGYVESAAAGLLAGRNAARFLAGKALWAPPATTALGALVQYIANFDGKNFQPMNVNFGLVAPLVQRVPKKEKNAHLAERALQALAKAQAEGEI
ncbi:MAG: methylenetetrahydrofolate--tRNA-(uracil(54)-C(5))-methyltransferase (FADH(2)-oxidizing) TrmFO [Veillonellaceae bacterium]|nr:methylenetetrahydrofolate--tRNA-(uracil(54)-C(5))-methyltransferase (FADH(2)-oxidizing) TrmFO [Veillonellaceae bacterium]